LAYPGNASDALGGFDVAGDGSLTEITRVPAAAGMIGLAAN